MKDITLKVRSTPSNDLVHLNLVYVNKDLFPSSVSHIKIAGHIFSVSPHQDVQAGEVAMNAFQRKATKVAPGENVVVEPFVIPTKGFVLDTLSLEIEFLVKRATTVKIDGQKFVEVFRRRYVNQVFAVGQTWAIDFEGTNYVLCANDLSCIDEETLQVCQSNLKEKPLMGVVGPDTNPILKVTGTDGKYIKLTNVPSSSVAASRSSELFKKDFNFETLGIGGLNKEFGDIFRRAFASRIFPPSVLQKLGIQHVKGILLYGPPGTGKTLMARQIGKMLNCQEPKVVNGPEIMSKYVGESEANIRRLFETAEADYRAKGDESDLHLVIFDEIDAICKSRGTSRDGTGVNDAVVNQLLSKIDGVEAIPNVLLIGMTNRKDLIDEAMLRPGRFEVQIEISLPNEEGRLQIFTIHTTSIKKHGFMEPDVDLLELAQKARNFSGAEIEGLVKSAVSFAFNRQVDVNNIGKPIDPNSIRIGRSDFMAAFDEVKPAFGVEEEELDKYIRNGLFDYGTSWQGLLSTCMSFTHQLSTSNRTSSLSVLLEGLPASGKTALAAHIAKSSQFPYVKVVSGENMVGYSEIAKCNLIRKVFDDAYKSPFNVIILDDLERLVEYVHIGPRFSNSILQTLLVLIKKQPPKDRKLLIIGTTSSHEVLESMELTSVFNATITVPQLSNSLGEVSKVLSYLNVNFVSKDEEAQSLAIIPPRIGIKNLILVVEMAQAAVTQGRSGQPALLTKSALVQALSTCKCDV